MGRRVSGSEGGSEGASERASEGAREVGSERHSHTFAQQVRLGLGWSNGGRAGRGRPAGSRVMRVRKKSKKYFLVKAAAQAPALSGVVSDDPFFSPAGGGQWVDRDVARRARAVSAPRRSTADGTGPCIPCRRSRGAVGCGPDRGPGCRCWRPGPDPR